MKAKSKKISLSTLQVKSFITSIDKTEKQTIDGMNADDATAGPTKWFKALMKLFGKADDIAPCSGMPLPPRGRPGVRFSQPFSPCTRTFADTLECRHLRMQDGVKKLLESIENPVKCQ